VIRPKKFDNTGDFCLSMWQPWGSLLVHGIKRAEGRSWYSDIRGLLWIASGSRKPRADEIESVQYEYISRYGISDEDFPVEYPCSVLLGCVNVDNILSNSEYREFFGDEAEDNQSAFIFVCSNPRILPFPIPISGEHKLWNLPHDVLRQAKLQLQINL
jgi:activating signal cointegrator 1